MGGRVDRGGRGRGGAETVKDYRKGSPFEVKL